MTLLYLKQYEMSEKVVFEFKFQIHFLFCVFVQEFMYFIPIAFHIEIYDSIDCIFTVNKRVILLCLFIYN